MGSAAIGGTRSFIYWNGSAFVSKALGDNAFTSISKLSQLTNDSGYITGITKSMVESVLTGNITSHTHSQYLTSHQTVTLASGTNNGTLKLTVGSATTDNIAVKGLGSAAYTNSTAYAAASHTHSQYLTAHQPIYALTIQKNGTTAGTYTPNSQAATINISDVASAATLSTHTTNTTVHITANERTLWNKITGLFDVDTDGDVYVKNGKGFYTEGFISAGAKGTSGGGSSTYTQKEWAQIKDMTATVAGSLASAYAVKEAYSEAKTLIDVNTGNITSLTSRVTTLEGKATAVSFSQTLTSGTKIGAITVDGTTTNIYAPTPPTKVSQLTNDSGYITGITKAMVEGVLTGNITSHTHSYLPLSGGTITGALTINTYIDCSFILDEPTGEKYHKISFRASGKEYAYLLAYNHSSENKLVFNGSTILHSSNVGSYALKLDGSNAMTGGINWNNASVGTNVDTFGEGLIVGKTTDSGTTLDSLGYRYASVLNVSNGAYRFQIASAAANANKLLYRGYNANAKTYFDWKTIAFTDSNVASASKWSTARTITLTGSVTGSVSIDGSANVSLVTTTNHTHSYLPLSGGTMSNTNVVTNLNADFLDGYNASSFAKVASANNLISLSNEFNFVPSAFAGEVHINYRTTTGTDGAITKYNFDNGAGGLLASISQGQFSGNAATATNADKLDGYHAEQVLTSDMSSTVDLNEISVPSIYRLSNQNPNLPSSIFNYGNLLTVKYVNSDTAWQLLGAYNSDNLWFRRGSWKADGTGTLRTNAWKAIAFTDSNVASATKLQNSRTLWGQSFNGTGNVSGALSGVTNINSALYIDSSGKVGIGTPNPVYKLDVDGDIAIRRVGSLAEYFVINSNDISVNYKGYDLSDGNVRHRFYSNDNLLLTLDGFNNIASFAGGVNIAGVAYASEGLVSDGYISAASTSTSSDIRLKDNISEISSEMALKWLSMLKPKSWTWNSLAGVKGRSMGFVAQDVEGILPQMIRKRRDNDYLSLDYTQLHALEVSALQSHEKRIEELERENKILKEELYKLKLNAN